MFVVEVVAGCVFDVYVEPFYVFRWAPFLWWWNTCMMSLMGPKG